MNLHNKPVVWIVTVNYRTAHLVVESLRAIASQVEALGGGKVVIVDNASGDGSAEEIAAAIEAEGWISFAKVMSIKRNGGFAFGNNIGFAEAISSAIKPEYLMLLNPDSAARHGAIEALVNFMETHPRAGIAGSRLENADGGLECSAHNFHSPLSELVEGARFGLLTRWLPNYEVTPIMRYEPHLCDWVSGSSMMIRREVIEDIGPMDEGFFLYFEEVDFFQRAAKAGWQTWYVPESVVMHIEGASTGIKTKKRRPAYWFNSRRRYFVKHYGVGGLLLADMLWSAGRMSFFVRRFFRLGARGEMNDPESFTSDLLISDLRAVLNGDVWKIAEEKVG